MIFYSLNSLMVFSTVVRFKSFSKAAEVLFMTQPGVSNHVTQLEAQTGLVLINRDRGRFELTREGKIVYKSAERIETMARELEDRLRTLQKGTTPSLRIGTTVNYARKIMPRILGDFQKRVPGIKLKLDSGASAEMEKALLSGQNDVIIVASQHVSKKIHLFPFVREELSVFVSKDHPLALQGAVSLSDIYPYPFITREEGSATRSVVLNAFSAMNISPSVLIEANSTEFIKEWVSQGKGVSILIRRALEGELDGSIVTVPLVEPLYLEVSVGYLKSKKYDPSIHAFVTYLRETAAKPDTQERQLSN